MLEFLGEQSVLIFFVIFVIFIVVAYKLAKFLFKALMVGLVAGMFPVIGSMFLGLEIEITLFNIIWFAVTGVGLFVLYSLLKLAWRLLKAATAPVRWARKPAKHEKEKK